jgi:hypothetical protein
MSSELPDSYLSGLTPYHTHSLTSTTIQKYLIVYFYQNLPIDRE